MKRYRVTPPVSEHRLFSVSYFPVFWLLPWSAPLRAAAGWLSELAWPDSASPVPAAPRWLRPLCVQRMVGRAVAERARWLKQHPCLNPYRFGDDSDPGWDETTLLTYDRRCLRDLSEASVRWLFGVEVERILRLIQTSPALLGEGAWVASLLAACEHIAQVYHELKRRHKAMQARATLREELRLFLEWQGEKA
jgi:hypothetical protein